MKKKNSSPSLDELTILDFFAAMALQNFANAKIPLTKRAALAYAIGQDMLKVRQEIEDKSNLE